MRIRIALFSHFCIFAMWLSLAHAVNRSMCGPGTFFRGGSCSLCPKGTYQNETGSLGCNPCPQGSFFRFTGAQGADACEPCPAGTFNDKKGSTSISACKKCPKGKDSIQGSQFCLACQPGEIISFCSDPEYPASEALRTRRCKAFYYTLEEDEPLNLKCRACPASTFAKGVRECQACQQNEFSEAGSASCSKCSLLGCGFKCNDFRVFDLSKREFDPTFSDFVGGCVNCPPGLVGNKRIGATKCIPCPTGTSRQENDDGSCKPCKQGENTKVSGAPFCLPDDTPCPENLFRDARGACQKCNRMQRYNPRKKMCEACRPGEESTGGVSTNCTKCPKDSISSPEGCFCGRGTKTGANGQCVKCPMGSAGSGCISCFDNTIAPGLGTKECLPCPKNRIANRDHSKCMTCPKGTVLRNEDCVVPATNCSPMHERVLDIFGALFGCSITKCPAGEFKVFQSNPTEYRGRLAFCNSCLESQRYNPRKNTCDNCPRGTFSKGGLDTKCKKCPRGAVRSGSPCECDYDQERIGGVCKPCPRGSTRLSSQARCMKCPDGTRQAGGGRSLRYCETCPAGTFSKAGATKCKKCPPGTVSSAGFSNCVKPGSLNRD